MAGRKPCPDFDCVNLELTRPQMAQVFGVSVGTVSRWTTEGMPQAARGRFLLGPCFTWYAERITARGDDRDDTLTASKVKLFDRQRQHGELTIQERRKELVQADETEVVMRGLFDVVDRHLMALPARVAGQVAGKSPTAAAQAILREARETRRQLADDLTRFAQALVDADR